jgi:ComF family protein
MIRARFDSIWKRSCVFCGDPDNGSGICDRCLLVLPWNDVICEHCGQPVADELPAGVSCAACQARPPTFDKARSPLHYAFPADTALKAMKFRRQLMYAPAFARLLAPVFGSEFESCDALVAVPLHRWRHITRGFNQAGELCKELAAQVSIPVLDNVFRVRATPTQSGLSSAKRKQNLRGAFAVDGKLQARYPLIIDDVITTGATCEHLARALKIGGAKKVGVLTVARSSYR